MFKGKVIHKWSTNESHQITYREKVRYGVFLRDVWKLAFFSVGGPQVHITLFINLLVKRHKYLSLAELMELNALCQIIPGPTSTQTLTATAFKIGGPRLAFLTLLIWITPAVGFMSLAGMLFLYLESQHISMQFTEFIQPIAVGFVAHAAFSLSSKVVNTNRGLALMVCAIVVSYLYQNPYIPPLLLISGGILTGLQYKSLQREERKEPIKIEWANFVLYAAVLILAAIVGHFTMNLPVRLFENFYRNGSLIFGGGQVLIPLLYNEFVVFKHYLSSQEFLTGYALVQALPGPVFAFCSYVGVLSMRDFGFFGQLIGSVASTVGIFLPGTFLIFFLIRFWNQLKKYRGVKASLEGINSVGCGLVASAALQLFEPLDVNHINVTVITSTFLLLYFTKIPSYWIIILGLLGGIIHQNL